MEFEILTVKKLEFGYLLNGNINVPNAPGNSDYEAIQKWIAKGNVPDPEFTLEELTQKLNTEALNSAKAEKDLAKSTIKVTTSKGNTFDGNDSARSNMLSAIEASSTLGITEQTWKLADNTSTVVTLEELREAHALAIVEFGRIVLS